MRNFIFIITIVALLVSTISYAQTYTVERVIDGDTIVVTTPEGKSEKVRLIGIDAPEIFIPDEDDPISLKQLTEEELPLPRLSCKVTNTHNGPVDLYSPKPEVGDTFQIDLAEITKGKSTIIYDSSNKIMGRKPQISARYPFRILKVTRRTQIWLYGKVNNIRMVSRHPEDDIYSINLDLDYKYWHQNEGVAGISGSIRSETPTIKGITFFDCKVKKD